MIRVIREPRLEVAPVNVPAPDTWDPTTESAYRQGYDTGFAEGRAQGRRELDAIAGSLTAAVEQCASAVAAAKAELNARVIELAELFVTTALRHAPDTRVAGLLVRVGEALDALDQGAVSVHVAPELVADVRSTLLGATGQVAVTVVDDATLQPGEFRIRSEWAEAEGTWDRYVQAAREALDLHLADES